LRACDRRADARFVNLEVVIIQTVKTYSRRVDADLAKIALDAAGVPSVVVDIGLDLEGGAAGVRLLVPDEYVETALTVLQRS
jgi:hypothetical protein